MAEFQLAGPAANASKISYGESRKLYQSLNEQYNFDHFEGSRSCESCPRGTPNGTEFSKYHSPPAAEK